MSKFDQRAYQEGAEAQRCGVPRNVNPYGSAVGHHDAQRISYVKGWHDSRSAHLGPPWSEDLLRHGVLP